MAYPDNPNYPINLYYRDVETRELLRKCNLDVDETGHIYSKKTGKPVNPSYPF
jgi:hypothetical protein